MAKSTWAAAAATLAGSLCPSRGSGVGSTLAPLEGAGKNVDSIGPRTSSTFAGVRTTLTKGGPEETMNIQKPGGLSTLTQDQTKTPATTNSHNQTLQGQDSQTELPGTERQRRGSELGRLLLKSPQEAADTVQDLVRAELVGWTKIPRHFDLLFVSKFLLLPEPNLNEVRKYRETIKEGVREIVSAAVKEFPLLEKHFDVTSPESLTFSDSDEKVIGRGERSVVFRATKQGTKEEVALMMVKASAVALNKLLIHLILNSSGSSDILCGFEGVFRDNSGRIFFAMPKYGNSLLVESDQRNKEKNFYSDDELLELAQKMTQAVDGLHKRGCVHRNLGLESFVRNGNKITLVGFSRAVPRTNEIIHPMVFRSAPEFRDCYEERKAYDYRVDIHALSDAIRKLAVQRRKRPGLDAWLLQFNGLLEKMSDQDPMKRPSLESVLESLAAMSQQDSGHGGEGEVVEKAPAKAKHSLPQRGNL